MDKNYSAKNFLISAPSSSLFPMDAINNLIIIRLLLKVICLILHIADSCLLCAKIQKAPMLLALFQ